MQILALDIAGNPFRWLDIERAITYAAGGKVAWEIGDEKLVFHGGTRRTGERSQIALRPVIALAKSEAMVHHLQSLPLGHDNGLLFRRDRGYAPIAASGSTTDTSRGITSCRGRVAVRTSGPMS